MSTASRSKGKNFTEEEEMQLCRSYLYVGKDSINGTSQKSTTFWERLTKHFNDARPEGSEQRPYRSLECKWSLIQHDVAKFCGSIAAVRDLCRSGSNADDELEDALKLYQQTHTTKGVRDNKPFKFVHCWRILSVEPKWQDYRVGRVNNSNSSLIQPNSTIQLNSTSNTATAVAAATTRPQGNKAAKNAAKSDATAEKINKRIATATIQMARASNKRAKALEEANTLLLFTAPLHDLEAPAREYIRIRQRQELAKLKHQEQEEEEKDQDQAVEEQGDNVEEEVTLVSDSDNE
jgi:No apical meristem-associated C-terminal domain